jgi:hypothetical protein
VCFLQKEMRNLTGAVERPFVEPRARNSWFKEVGKRKSNWQGPVARFSAASGEPQDVFPKPSLFTTANSRCQSLYLLAKTGDSAH